MAQPGTFGHPKKFQVFLNSDTLFDRKAELLKNPFLIKLLIQAGSLLIFRESYLSSKDKLSFFF